MLPRTFLGLLLLSGFPLAGCAHFLEDVHLELVSGPPKLDQKFNVTVTGRQYSEKGVSYCDYTLTNRNPYRVKVIVRHWMCCDDVPTYLVRGYYRTPPQAGAPASQHPENKPLPVIEDWEDILNPGEALTKTLMWWGDQKKIVNGVIEGVYVNNHLKHGDQIVLRDMRPGESPYYGKATLMATVLEPTLYRRQKFLRVQAIQKEKLPLFGEVNKPNGDILLLQPIKGWRDDWGYQGDVFVFKESYSDDGQFGESRYLDGDLVTSTGLYELINPPLSGAGGVPEK